MAGYCYYIVQAGDIAAEPLLIALIDSLHSTLCVEISGFQDIELTLPLSELACVVLADFALYPRCGSSLVGLA